MVGILNALWYESRTARQETRDETPPLPPLMGTVC